jgi:transcriptional/translational regulatory protein YebC/TACO1
MPRQPDEGVSQKEMVLRLRAAIDTARKYPSQENIDKAIKLAIDHPKTMRSSHASHNLGVRRWEWLGEHGVVFVGESVEIAGTQAFKGTITPEVKK